MLLVIYLIGQIYGGWHLYFYENYKMEPFADSNPALQNRFTQLPSIFSYTPFVAVSDPEVYCFSGNASSLKLKAQKSDVSTFEKFISFRINLTGTTVQAYNACCFGQPSLLEVSQFPLCFICCDWWKKIVNQLYKVQASGYESLVSILKKSQVQELYLLVQDNMFNSQKAQILAQGLSGGKIKNFVFINSALGFDNEGSNFSDFPKYMRQFKEMIPDSSISWADQFL